MKLYYLLPLLLISNAHAATWERPAGGYTPTNHSVNITKYQTDSANHIAISSAKVDGDINKAFQGLNDIESRTPPSVTGNAGKFLTNNGTATSWGLVSNTTMSSGGVAAGLVLQASGSGGVGWGTVSASALGSSGVSAGTYIFPQLTIASSGLVTSATTPTVAFVSGSIFIATTISATQVSSSQVSSTNVSTSLVTYQGYDQPVMFAAIRFNGVGGCSVRSSKNATCGRSTTGVYDISFTIPAPNANYFWSCNNVKASASTISPYEYPNVSPTTAAFHVTTVNTAGSPGTDVGDVSCQFWF